MSRFNFSWILKLFLSFSLHFCHFLPGFFFLNFSNKGWRRRRCRRYMYVRFFILGFLSPWHHILQYYGLWISRQDGSLKGCPSWISDAREASMEGEIHRGSFLSVMGVDPSFTAPNTRSNSYYFWSIFWLLEANTRSIASNRYARYSNVCLISRFRFGPHRGDTWRKCSKNPFTLRIDGTLQWSLNICNFDKF